MTPADTLRSLERYTDEEKARAFDLVARAINTMQERQSLSQRRRKRAMIMARGLERILRHGLGDRR